MDIVFYIVAALCLLGGLAGCILPGIPGPPLAYAGLLLLQVTGRQPFTVSSLIFWAILVVVVQLLDYLTPLWGTKYGGGSRAGKWGCIIGTFVGIFLFPPWGILWGPFAGAVLGELMAGRDTGVAFKAGAGAFAGFVFSTLLKVILCSYFIFLFIHSFF
ncbi:MAG: DUF456 domain-containing protein [Tannerellaceae bacterium]|nr:DUF456 domain-containing protein [Tannerellaceae bacterium]